MSQPIIQHPSTRFRSAIVRGLALTGFMLVAAACSDSPKPTFEPSVPTPLAEHNFEVTIEPGVGRVLEADADHPAALAIAAFYEAYLAAGTSAGDAVELRLASFDYADRDDVVVDMERRVDALRAEAGEEGMLADPFLCSVGLPSKVFPIAVSELADRVMVRMQARHPESAIPQLFTVEAMRDGDRWQLAAVNCR